MYLSEFKLCCKFNNNNSYYQTPGHFLSSSLSDSLNGVYYNKGKVSYQREYLVSAPDQLIAVRLSASKKKSINGQIMVLLNSFGLPVFPFILKIME